MTEYVIVIVSGTRSDVNNHMTLINNMSVNNQTLVSALHLPFNDDG